MIPNMRPNVFTSCNIVKKVKENKTKPIGLVCSHSSEKVNPSTIAKVENLEDVISLFGDNSSTYAFCKSIFNNTKCDIYVIGVHENDKEEYKKALDIFLKNKDIYCIVSDYNPIEIINHMKNQFESLNFCCGRKFFIANVPSNEKPLEVAKQANCSRILISYPCIRTPLNECDISNALLAALISKGDLIKSNFAGQKVKGEYYIKEDLTEEQKNELLYNGVTVFENISNEVEVIRSVTTNTFNQNGEKDSTYRDISVVYSIDFVFNSITDLLKKRLNGITSTATSLGSILTLVICELNTLKENSIIADYQRPVIRLDENDKSICIIELSVILSQGVNQVYINLNINL